MSCNNCNCNPCCCSVTPFRYRGPNVDCLGVNTNDAYDTLIEFFANQICDLNEVVDGVQGIDHISFTSSTGVPPNVPGQAGQIDTYTVWGDALETIAISTFDITNGAAGTDGADGAAGADGADGTPILGAYNSATGVGNGAAIGTDILFSLPLLANTLPDDGDELEIFAYTEYLENDPIDLVFRLAPGHSYVYNVANSADDIRFIKIKIARIDQNNQFWTFEALVKDEFSVEAVQDLGTLLTTFDLSTATTFDILTDNTIPAGANALLLKKAVVYKNKI